MMMMNLACFSSSVVLLLAAVGLSVPVITPNVNSFKFFDEMYVCSLYFRIN